MGLVTAVCLADRNHDVACYDPKRTTISQLQQAQAPFYEPNLPELLERNVHAGRLRFEHDPQTAVRGASMAIIAVDTPVKENGEVLLEHLTSAASSIISAATGELLLVLKSTAPPQALESIRALVPALQQRDAKVSVASNPEFLREGNAIEDFMRPDRIVIGADDEDSFAKVAGLYAGTQAPIIRTTPTNASLIKYMSNAYLANRVSFVNEMADVCLAFGADIDEVAAGMGADHRIGRTFFKAGPGFGGSCLPKDTTALVALARGKQIATPLLDAVLEVNATRAEKVIGSVTALCGGLKAKSIAILGLAFKAETDDVRESPALKIIDRCLAAGARIKAHDPRAQANARIYLNSSVRYCENAYETAKDCDAVIIATEWDEYTQLDYGKLRNAMRDNVLFDARGITSGTAVRPYGFRYGSVAGG